MNTQLHIHVSVSLAFHWNCPSFHAHVLSLDSFPCPLPPRLPTHSHVHTNSDTNENEPNHPLKRKPNLTRSVTERVSYQWHYMAHLPTPGAISPAFPMKIIHLFRKIKTAACTNCRGLCCIMPFHLTVMLVMRISSYGLSVLGLVFIVLIFCTYSIPLVTRPKTVCLLSNHGWKYRQNSMDDQSLRRNDLYLLSALTVGATVMKNWDPLVFGPALAMLRVYGLSCLRDGWNSSSNSPPHIDSPPVPLPAHMKRIPKSHYEAVVSMNENRKMNDWGSPRGSPVCIIKPLMTLWKMWPL